MPTTPTIPNELYTYEEWQQLGFQVQYGERSTMCTAQGVALFTPAQVRPRNSRPFAPQGEYRPPRRRPRPVDHQRPAPINREQVREQLGTWASITARNVRDETDFTITPSSEPPTLSPRMFWASSSTGRSPSTYTFLDDIPDGMSEFDVLEEKPKLLQRAVSEYAPQGEPTGFQKFARRTK